MSHRTCTIDGCERKHQAKGLCSTHYAYQHRDRYGRKDQTYSHLCEICGTSWSSFQRSARFCSPKCAGVNYSTTQRRRCVLPDDHPVMVLIAADKERVRVARQAARRSTFEWRTARECPGCACMFTPLYTPTAITCSRPCARRCAKRRRRARENGARGSWTWSEFMRIAKKFDYCCAYCGEKPDRLDPDHVVPLSRGGFDSPSNLLPACAMCNSSKCAMTLDEWAAWRDRRGLPLRATTWPQGDRRYWHLTQAMLAVA